MTDLLETTPRELYIGGQWRPASDGATIEVRDPATEEVIAGVASASLEDGLAAVGAAHEAGPQWAARPPRERAEILRRAFDLLTAQKDDFARLITRENGKCLRDALGEMGYAAEFFRWYSEEAVRNLSEVSTAPAGANKILVLQQPVGVSVLITPWNFPAAMATRKIAPALAAGCSVILKPASETPLTALALALVLEQAGVPPGVVNVLPCSRSGEVFGALLHDPRVRKLSFTGSTQVGRILLGQAADSVVNCSMELGGNAPFLVFADANIEDAVAGAMVAKMRNGGEACTAANRFLVASAVAGEFSEKFAAAMGALKVGPGLEDGVELGPLINKRAQRDMVDFVEDAVAHGAEVLTGGTVPNRRGYFYPPTVLTGMAGEARVLNQEIFGPIAPIVAFDDMDAAIAEANNTEYGLISYIYTGDLATGLATAERLETGMVGLNRGVVSDPAAPFGGVKQSGLGREGAHDGMLEFLEKKYIGVSW